MSEVLWGPTPEQQESTLLWQFMRRHSLGDYHETWRWSVTDLEAFWAAVWADGEVIARRPYDEVLVDRRMPGARWFAGAELSYAENLLRPPSDLPAEAPAIVAVAEGREDVVLSWERLRREVARVQSGMAALGIGPGDRVAAVLPNCAETVVLMLAATGLGATFTSCSPDFGFRAIVDRLSQAEPKLLCVVDGYRYAGREHRLQDKLSRVLADIPVVDHVVTVRFAECPLTLPHPSVLAYEDLAEHSGESPVFTPVPADHPLYVLYSSGTTGPPKSIVHGTAGTLAKHLEEHRLQCDLRPGDVLLWFTTCGWMMWNWLVSALASGATIVCYDGSPAHPDPGVLWRLVERRGITHLGVSPRYLATLAERGVRPAEEARLGTLRALLSTGAPLLPEQFDWAYANVKADMQLASISGGTDLIGCFASGAPVLPVRRGELQARTLGMAVEAWDERGRSVIGERGELVCAEPFPSMPLGFLGDDGSRYRDAYFAAHPGVWTHGDYVEIRPEGGVVIHGRSDTTLNPGGVRIGTAELYRVVESCPEVTDSLAVGRLANGEEEIVLAVVLAEGVELDDALADRLRATVRDELSPRHVPRHVVAVPAIPYTINGKKVEKAARNLLAGQRVENREAVSNPEALEAFAELRLD